LQTVHATIEPLLIRSPIPPALTASDNLRCFPALFQFFEQIGNILAYFFAICRISKTTVKTLYQIINRQHSVHRPSCDFAYPRTYHILQVIRARKSRHRKTSRLKVQSSSSSLPSRSFSAIIRLASSWLTNLHSHDTHPPSRVDQIHLLQSGIVLTPIIQFPSDVFLVVHYCQCKTVCGLVVHVLGSLHISADTIYHAKFFNGHLISTLSMYAFHSLHLQLSPTLRAVIQLVTKTLVPIISSSACLTFRFVLRTPRMDKKCHRIFVLHLFVIRNILIVELVNILPTFKRLAEFTHRTTLPLKRNHIQRNQ